MLRLEDSWVWDFWTADDGEQYHLFFLYASRALSHPDERHYRASIGHAVSTDLRTWRRVRDALVRSDAPAFDELATWTGSITRREDGLWFMFYTGTELVDGKNVQRVGYATSPDLMVWTKSGRGAVAEADPQWYEKLADGTWGDEAFRDPWVMPDPDGHGWHLLVTARANHGPVDERGVIGHAISPDLEQWTVVEPLSTPDQGFGQMEVMQSVELDGQHFLLFSCLAGEVSDARRPTLVGRGGVWAAPGASALGPFDVAGAQQLTDNRLYVGRIVTERESGRPYLLAFRNDSDAGFVGEITEPCPVSVRDGRLVVTGDEAGLIPA